MTRRLMLLVATLGALCAGPRSAGEARAAPQAETIYSGGRSIYTQTPTVGRRGLYVVQRGDTLWELSDLFFGNPWYWPRLWSFNPQVTNPHWIYPGDVLQMEPPTPPSKKTLRWTESRYTKRKPKLEISARYVGYLPEHPFERSGRIDYAREERHTLGAYDEVYVTFGEDTSVRKGQRFTIYRKEGPIHHPDEDRVAGYKIRHLGVAKVLDASHEYVKCLILESYREVERGDLVTSIFPHQWVVGPVENDVAVEATLVDIDAPVNYSGQFHYVYIDKGRNDGLERGNRLVAQRRGDPLWREGPPSDVDVEEFPWERVGEVMIVEPFENTSLAIVSRSIRALEPGARLFAPEGY